MFKNLTAQERKELNEIQFRSSFKAVRPWVERLSAARAAVINTQQALDNLERDKDREISLLKKKIERLELKAQQNQHTLEFWSELQKGTEEYADDQSTCEEGSEAQAS